MNDPDGPQFFGEWLKRRRQSLDLTQVELAGRAGCSVFALRKIEAGERRPSKDLAGLLAAALKIPADEQAAFVRAARGDLAGYRLPDPASPAHLSAGSPAPRIASPLHNWPPRPTPLVGRENELASLGRLLRDPLCRLLTLIGPGGIGKTRLAVEVAEQEQALFADGIWFAPFAPVVSPTALIAAIADALELVLRGQVTPQEQLLNHLASQQALLVLDNLEHLLAAAPLLVEILARAPRVKLLATSRERLNLHSEWVFVTEGLPTPPPDQLERAREYDAIRLFEQSARRTNADYYLADDDIPAVVQVCEMVDGMPLGIELAAAWTPLLNCQEIAQELARGLDFLSSTLRDLPERQRSLRAVFDHSWRLLTGDERAVLARLAIFRGGFERDAAETVAGASLPILLTLTSKSLIRRSERSRCDLHEVVRQYAFAHLSQSPERVETCDRHSRFYLARLNGLEPALHSSAQRQIVRSLLDEIDNLRLAWGWAITRDMFDAVAPAIRAFGCLFELSGWLDEGVKLLETAIRAVGDAIEDPLRRRVVGEALAQQALLLMRQGHFAASLARAGESLAVLRPLGDTGALVRPLIFRSIILHMAGDLDESQAAGEEALAHGRLAGDHWGEAYADFLLGHVARLRGDFRGGYERMRRSVSLWRPFGDPHSLALALNFFGTAAIGVGEYAEAEACLQESLRLCQEVGDRWGLGTALRFLGVAALAQGDAVEAQGLLRQSLDAHRGVVTGWDIVRSQIYLADATRAAGDLEAARRIAQEALAEVQTVHADAMALEALAVLAALHPPDAAEQAAGIVAFVLQHPACLFETRQRAACLWEALAARLPVEGLAAAQAWAGERSLESVIAAAMQHPLPASG